jgi:hypothetical protein
LVITETIVIHAPVRRIWDTFTDLTCWIDWNTVISNVRSEAKSLRNGNSIRCIFRPYFFPVNVEIKVKEVIRHELIVWTATKKGLFAQHEFIFQTHKKGVTVTSREKFTGILAIASGVLLPRKKMRSLTKTFLKDLKNASEGGSLDD